MPHRTAIGTRLISGVVTCFFATACAIAAETAPATIPVERLAEAVRAAKADFRPVSAADVERTRVELLEAIDRLEARLAIDGPNGEAWGRYLRLDTLKQQAAGATPDVTVLRASYARFTAQEEGLELVWFLDVQRALSNYIFAVSFVDGPQIRAAFETMLDKLAAALETHATNPTPETAAVIGETVRRLQDTRQAEELVQAIHRHFVHPNLWVEVDADILGAGIVEQVDDVTPIRDCILRTDIHATAHTRGRTTVETVPHADFGVLDTLFLGTTLSDSVGYHRPVTIVSSSTTDLWGKKRLCIDAEGLWSEPAVTRATTAVCIQDIQSWKGRRMVERMAWKRSAKQQSMAECIASRHAEARLAERIDSQAAESLARANEAYVEKFRQPFIERKLFPGMLRFSTDERSLDVVALQAGDGKVAAPATPPALAVDAADMSLRLHESMINNLAHDAIAGRTVHEEKVQAAVTNLLGHLPDEMKGDENDEPFAITFARQLPVSVSFADDGFKVVVRGVEYRKGAQKSAAMNITAAYKIEKTDEGFKAVRQGEIEVFPPDFTPGSGQQIDAQRQIMRTLLKKRFAKVFKPEFLGKGLELPGRWKDAGKMLPVELVCRDGWLIVAWKRTAGENVK